MAMDMENCPQCGMMRQANGNGAPQDKPETPQDQPDEPDQPSNGEGAAPTKLSQQQANYRESNKVQCCGLCPHWQDAKQNWGECEVTEGDISCFGLCDQYVRGDNPFRQGETGEFAGGRPVPIAQVTRVAVAPAPPMAAMGGMMAPPRLRIGTKTYGQ